MRVLALALALALALPTVAALALPPLGETPSDWSCDAPPGEARRVCAGIGGGGDATCAPTNGGARANCTWSAGWISRAWSTEGESGSETHAGTIEVTQCSSVSGCVTLHASTFELACSWLAALACEDQSGTISGATSFPLAMGECVVVMVRTQTQIAARVDGLLAPLAPDAPAFASYHHASEDGDAICLVDDGR